MTQKEKNAFKKKHRYKLYYNAKINGYVILKSKCDKFKYYDLSGLIPNNNYGNYVFIIPKLLIDSNYSKLLNAEIINEYKRYNHCKNRIDSMFSKSKNLFFLTFTISNKFYDDMYSNQDNFQRKIKKFLNDMGCIDWCFNLDFGSKNERLHAHAIICHNDSYFDLKVLQKKWKIGNLDVAKTYNDNSVALERYLAKFTNHSFKNTTMCRVQYSRKVN